MEIFRAALFGVSIYMSFMLFAQLLINLIKAHGVNTARIAGHSEAKAEYSNSTGLTALCSILWATFYCIG